MIRLEHIHKLVGTFSIKDVSIEIPKGYITGLIGRNGCGKTTLLHILLGLYKPDEGKMVFGDEKKYVSSEREIKESIGVVLQERLYENNMTLLENGRFYGAFYKNFDETYFKELLAKYGLDAKKKYRKLSKGEELKFQFAFALAHYPKYLFLDEPTGNFDPEFRDCFLKSLQDFIADGEHTVLLITHLTNDLDQIADYLIYMENGGILLSTDMETFRDGYRIVTGEKATMEQVPEADVIHMEHGDVNTRALVRYSAEANYGSDYILSVPSIEEFMYFVSKREGRKGIC